MAQAVRVNVYGQPEPTYQFVQLQLNNTRANAFSSFP
jgi:hypothetical protein